jgi:hypothetical protein
MNKKQPHVTIEPDPPAPPLLCPTCDKPLVYLQTVFGGVYPRERWDYFQCRPCGLYAYRQRTRRLRLAEYLPFAQKKTG